MRIHVIEEKSEFTTVLSYKQMLDKNNGGIFKLADPDKNQDARFILGPKLPFTTHRVKLFYLEGDVESLESGWNGDMFIEVQEKIEIVFDNIYK